MPSLLFTDTVTACGTLVAARRSFIHVPPPFCGCLGMKHLIAVRVRGGGVMAGAHQPAEGQVAVADGPTNWRKSKQCESMNCVEVALDEAYVAIRNSALPDGPVVEVSVTAWGAFCAALRAGEFSC